MTCKSKEDFYSTGYYRGFTLEPRFVKVAKIFDELKGDRLLDVGCGDGDITLLLKERMDAREVYGVELSHEAVTVAVKKGVCAYHMDIDDDNLPFRNGFFDVIYCGEIIEHLFNPDHLLEEAHRVLKRNGICVLTTPNLAGWSSRFALFFGYQPYPMAASPLHEGAGKLLIKSPQGQWGHIRVLTLRALKELVCQHGFSIRQVAGCSVTVKGPGSLLLKIVASIDTLISRFPSLSTRVILVLKKE